MMARLHLLFILVFLFSTQPALQFDSESDEDNSVEIEMNGEVDEIQELPGLSFEPNFKHYSGFLQVSPTHFLHYWFVTSQGDPTRDPLVFWFNGGPGCSSLDGLVNEMGPYLVNPDGSSLRKNPYSWNKYASMVYIEAPAGVGFSYATDGNTTTNDDLTSLENYEAIKQFLTRHPKFRNNSVYITGESYGGVYVPTVTARIVDGQSNFPIKLKGMAIGNGFMNAELNIDTSIRFAYGHGIIDEKVWNQLENECCRGCIDGCNLTALVGSCERMVEDIFEFLWHGGLNPYDLYRDCDPAPGRNSIRMEALKRGLIPPKMLNRFFSNATRTLRRRLQETGAHDYRAVSVPCLNDTDVTVYMNLPEVRKALHIPDSVGHWDMCSEDITEHYHQQYGDTTPFVKKVLKAHARVMLYYGDTDMACNFMLGQQFAAQLGLKRSINKQPWKYDRQIAGFKTLYAKGFLTFLTVRGAGHMAPQWRAPQMDYAFSQFLRNHPI